MATTTIPWGDGSGDNIYLTANALEGDQTVLVSSDANAGDERTKIVSFSATGVTPVTLTIYQEAGNLEPVFYTYLYFDGTAYIETDIVPVDNSSFRVTLGMERLESAQRIFDMTGSSGHIRAILGGNTDSTSRQVVVYYDTTTATSTTLTQTAPLYSFFLTPNNFGYGDGVVAHTKGSDYPNSNLIIGMIASGSGQPFTGVMSRLRIYGSDAQNVTTDAGFNSYTPYKTLRPCTYGSRHGLWDVDNNKFYGNTAGAGTLIACSCLQVNVSSIDTTNSSYFRIDNLSNAYAGYSSTNYATIIPVKGSRAASYIYFKFNTSSIPADATILAVFCSVKVYASTSATQYLPTRQVQMCSGTTVKGSSQNFSTTAVTRKFSGVTWTRAELDDICVRMYLARGTGNVNSEGYTARFYGATLNVLYR